MFSRSFLDEIKALALQIALRQRGERHLQDINVLHAKFNAERQELQEASEQWDELPDVAYYTACMVIVRDGLIARPAYPFNFDEPGYDESQELAEHYEEMHAREWSEQALSWLAQEIEARGITLAQLEAGTLAKYRLRAVQAKDIKAERAAILAAI